MGNVSDANHKDAYDRLWLLAKDEVRAAVCQIVAGGVAPTGLLVLILADPETSLARDLLEFTGFVAASEEHGLTIATLHGERRRNLLRKSPAAFAYSLVVPPGHFMILAGPVGVAPGVGTSKVVWR